MGFSEDDSMVRVDFWKPSGKWYSTVALKWDRYLTTDDKTGEVEPIHETFKRCLEEQFGDSFRGMRATCLEPAHEHSHPNS